MSAFEFLEVRVRKWGLDGIKSGLESMTEDEEKKKERQTLQFYSILLISSLG